MARNSELVRQWEILRAVDAARNGIGVSRLAADRGVHPRTIRRDLDALCRAGFPLFDEKVNGTSMWRLRARPFRGLEEIGLSLTEICALYLSHAMMCTLAGSPLLNDAERAFAKIERALPAKCREFLDHLPRVLKAKATGRKKMDERRLRDVLARALDAILLRRRVEMTYGRLVPRSDGPALLRTIEPHRIVYAEGGIYLIAYVPACGEMRTFAVERIQTFALLDETFAPRALPAEPFASSLGVFTGRPERVVLEFEPAAASYVRDREWHRSQQVEEHDDGRLTLTLDVSNDLPLRAWVLGFGPEVRVVAPISLAQTVFDAADATRRRYLRSIAGARAGMLAIRAS